MKKRKNAMYCIIYRLRKIGGLKIDTRNRTIFYEYQNEEQEAKMEFKTIKRLCKEFGFGRQAEIN